MRKIAFISILLAALGLVGCNTVAGFGKDIERSGAAIQRWAHH